jgi:hypothetical protein
LVAADIAPAAAVGDVAELLHIHMQQVTGVFMLITPDRLPGGPVHVREPVDPAPDQDRVDRGGGDSDLVGDRDRPEPLLPAHVHDLADHRGRRPVR